MIHQSRSLTLPLPATVLARQGAQPHPPPPVMPEGSSVGNPSPRCRVKGCIFPALATRAGKCSHHDLEDRSPSLFHSLQPTLLVLDLAKYGPRDSDSRDFRARDRLAAFCEALMEGVA